MNPLESLKERLKRKPEVHPNPGVKVILALPAEEIVGTKTKPLITAEKDEGKRAKDILEKIKQKKLSAVIKKFPEEAKDNNPLVSKAPILPEEKKKKPKKLLKEVVILQEEEEKGHAEDELPEGGPRLIVDELEKPIVGEDAPIVGEDAPIVGEEEFIAKPKKRSSKKVTRGIIPLGPELMVRIGDTSLAKRLPPLPVFNVKVSSYYMNNREIFVNFINGLFDTYKKDLLNESKGISCEDIGNDTGEVSLLTHQKIVRDYINLYTPYRGLLLYHGLGSGKTCSSIAIAEGIKSARKVIIMTPASLRRNYIEEIKKCGDLIYRKNQYWEWISVDDNPELVDPLSASLGLPREYIRRKQGAWLINIKKPNNYSDLSTSDKKVLNDQLDEMITNKYTFINYNGLSRDKFQQLTNNFETNIFDNAIVIIDEAHNLISRIVNKINNISKFNEKKRGPEGILPKSLSLLLYEFLLRADNCRVVLLTGTPIVNYPNEIGILFNILRGYIKTWNFTISVDTSKKISKETLQDIFAKEKILDYIDYVPSSKILTITRNPYGFENKITASSGYKGVTNEKTTKRNKQGIIEKDPNGDIVYEERGSISDVDFIKRIVKMLKNNDITAQAKGTSFTVTTALPDTLEEFINMFINKDTGIITNIDKFKRRIMGLTSYFRSAQEELLPAYDRNFDKHIVNIPMSNYQFKIYEDYRHAERKTEKPGKKSSGAIDKDGIFKEPSSTYRIFSRLACNFVMPSPPGRPNPSMYRAVAEAQKDAKTWAWMKKKYLDNKQEYNEDIQHKTKAFISKIAEENLDKYAHRIKRVLDTYLREYLTKDYREPIEVFAEEMGYGYLFEFNRDDKDDRVDRDDKDDRDDFLAIENGAKTVKKTVEKAKNKAEEKAKKADEKARKADEKADENARKADEKAEEKARKAEEKAEEKARKVEAKAEEKQEKERIKAEERERKRAEKIKKGGSINDSDLDSDSDSDDYDDECEGGAATREPIIEEPDSNEDLSEDLNENPAEKFVDADDESVMAIHLEGYKDEDAILREADELEGDEILEKMGSVEYQEAINYAMRYLQIHAKQLLSPEGLETYSPKFLAMLENITDPEHIGLNLVYSQFRSMEGIGIFALTLEANGFAKFKIKKSGIHGWELNMSEEDMGKPCYALYTGTEEAEEKEIIRNIYNGAWNYIPNNIAAQLKAKSSNNNLGEIIKVLMITSAGSEGINLKNTRYVHIMEPYWHPVRQEQVIGRARRICSHKDLPKKLQTVEVFVYIMTFTKEQLDSEFALELKLKDISKNPPYAPQTSDQKLLEISTIKEQLTSQLLIGVKEASIDCAVHTKSNTKEKLVCLSFGQPTVNDFSYNPNISQDENDTVADINRIVIGWEAIPFKITTTGKRYMLRSDTSQVYDYDSVIQAKQTPGIRPILLGKLVKDSKGDLDIVKERI